MQTTIFNQFLKAYNLKTINLLSDYFKVALLNSDYVIDSQTNKMFSELQTEGFEVSGNNYTSLPIIFETSITSDTEIQYKMYQINSTYDKLYENKLQWGDEDNLATFSCKYALIYRESDGLLVSVYDFGKLCSVEDGIFTVKWNSSSVLLLALNDSTVFSADTILSSTSNNSVSNKTVTDAFNKLGINLDNEELPEIDGKWNVDNLEKATDKDIEDLFNE